MHAVIWPPFQWRYRMFPLPLQVPCAPLLSVPSPCHSPLGTTHLTFLSLVLLFLECHVTCQEFIFISKWYSVVWLNHSLFIHSPVVGHLGCFQFWVFLIKLLWIFMPRSLCGHMYLFSSVQFSRTVVSDSLRPHEPKHARSPCPSPTPGVYPNSCALSRWCHLTISSSVIPFSSCPQCFPASGSFQMSQLFASSGQSTGVSASTSVLAMNTQDRPPLGWTGWISLQSKGLSRVFSNTTVQKHQIFSTQLSSQSNSHIHTWPLEKP